MELTKEQIKTYIESGGVMCPVCKSHDISAGSTEIGIGMAWQEVVCEGCGIRWRDLYTLTGVELPT